MRILLTNDDGIHAPGIAALHDALDGLGEIVPVAPLTVQSASSHGITFHEPLMCSEVVINERFSGIAVDGRPADCVKIALRAIWQERFGPGSRPDLTISGLNSGANVGINILYSGTVAAAMESAFLGVPSIAVSLLIRDRNTIQWARAAEHARAIIDRVLEHPLQPHDVINLNLPKTEDPEAPLPPVHVVPMNTAPLAEHYERRDSPAGQRYYWAAGSGLNFLHTTEGSDVETIFDGAATITPLSFDMTDSIHIDQWKDRLDVSSVSGS